MLNLDKLKYYIHKLRIGSKKIWDKIKSFLVSISPCGQFEELEQEYESKDIYIKFSEAAEILEEATGAFSKFNAEVNQEEFEYTCKYLTQQTEPRESYVKQNLLYAIRRHALRLYKFNPNISGNDWVMVGYYGQNIIGKYDEFFIKKLELESYIKTQIEKTKEHLEERIIEDDHE